MRLTARAGHAELAIFPDLPDAGGMTTETWKPIPKHPAYIVSDRGNLKRVRRVTKPRAVATRLNGGYLHADLWTDGRRYSRPIHQLVLEAFVGPMPPGRMCRHLDGNKLNNTPDNL